MTLSELITEIGDENITVQSIEASTVQIKDKKRTADTEITFATTEVDANQMVRKTGKVGLVIWIDRDDYLEAESELAK